VSPAVALLNYISSRILWRIFCQTGTFRGVFFTKITLAVRIPAAAMAGDIIFFSLAGPVEYYTGAHTVIFRGVFSLYYSPERRAKLRWAGGVGGEGGIVFFRVPNSLQGCNGWGERRGILYIKASVVQWK
jgi:hypothetical protein